MTYFVKVKNSSNQWINVEVSQEIYMVFQDSKKQLVTQKKADKRHLSALAIDSDIVSYKIHNQSQTSSHILSIKEKLEKIHAIAKTCTTTQKRRFYLNKFLGYSFVEIGVMENCSKTRVKKSVDIVCEKLYIGFRDGP